jgi:Dolichyl-phosphate-mannose-protein mannosyltransferase
MEKKRARRLCFLCLFVIVGLSAYLRLSGITWAIDSGYGHYLNFQPDEFISMRGMLPIQPLAGRMKAPAAYFEGTFNYYLWAAPEVLHTWWRGMPPIGEENMPPDRFKFILLTGRLMTVAFDLAAVVVLYAIIVELTGQCAAALLGALFYGIFPMQVIYSHFMRTHVLSNLLCVLVIWLSIKALKHRRWWLFAVAGVVSGLGGATRYPVGIILTIPCLFVLFAADAVGERWYRRFLTNARYLLSGPLWLLAGGYVVGLFIGEPMLFLDFPSVIHTISTETLPYVPPGAGKPFDLEPVWKYFSVLIPYATYPILWLVIYLAALYTVFRRLLSHIVLPLCLFTALYTYLMAKGYIVIFGRQVMLLLPVCCIFVGLASERVLTKVSNRPLLSGLVAALLASLVLPTLLFDWAYGQAMRRRDVRDLLRQDLAELVKTQSSITIGVSDSGCYFYTAMPGAFPLKSEHVAVRLQQSFSTPADFFVMGFERPLAENWRNFSIRQVESGGVFSFMKAYSRAPTVLGKRLDLSSFPPDMTYPFPTILLFRKVTKP